MFQNLDYKLIRYDDDTYGLHEVYTENGKVKGIISDPLIEGSSPEEIIEKLSSIIKKLQESNSMPLDMDVFRSNLDDFSE